MKVAKQSLKPAPSISQEPELEDLSYAELIKQRDAIEERILKLKERQFEKVISKLLGIIDESGISRADALRALRREVYPSWGRQPGTKKGKKTTSRRIYRHPDNPELQWERINRYRPNWIKELEEKGFDIEELRIDSNP